LVRATFDDDDIDARQSEFSREHEACGSAAGDYY
jgi:hypothetical protein